jgi:hypothetical protein
MFCDLVGSTAMSARLDPEDLRGIIGAYHRCCANLIEGGGGFVAKYMGDGVLAYFGYPQAHEHDASVQMLTFALGAACAGVGGTLIGAAFQFGPSSGGAYLLNSLAVVLIGLIGGATAASEGTIRLDGVDVTRLPVRPRDASVRPRRGLVTLSNEERDKIAAREFSGGRNGRVPRVHRRSAKTSVRSGGCEMALDIENVVDGGMRRKEFLG